MAISSIPFKTASGHAELGQRERRLGQRHRTVLLLVDGRRTEEEVRGLARQAGAGDGCFDELVALGLIALAAPAGPPEAASLPHSRREHSRDDADSTLHVDIPLDVSVPWRSLPTRGDAAEADSLLPAARTLQPESVLNDSALGDFGSRASRHGFDALDVVAGTPDAPLEQARALLLDAVRREAPLAGRLTMLRLRRARSRSELAALMDEVEARIVKPHRSLAAQQVLRRARDLLSTRVESVAHASR